MTDLFTRFNETNLKLQGDTLNLIKTKSVISAFVAKLLYTNKTWEEENVLCFQIFQNYKIKMKICLLIVNT